MTCEAVRQDDGFGVAYMLIGPRHAVVLAVSIHSLREHYGGPVAILAGDDAAEAYAKRIAADPRAGDVRVVRWQFVGGQRGSVYFAKTRMHELSPFRRTVFLDADTVIAGDFSGICPAGDEVVLTQFADWVTTGKRMMGRLLDWKDVAPVHVARMTGNAWPAINTGAIGFTRESRKFFACWQDVCRRKVSFICDEIACQLIYPDFPHRVVGDAFNWCPIHSRSPAEGAKVVHFHGGFAKLLDRREYRELWLPAFEQAAGEGFAEVEKWAGEVDGRLARTKA